MFDLCSTIDELKKEYRALCMKHHPDRGGDTATMQQVNREYEIALRAMLAGYGCTESEIDGAIEDEVIYREHIDAVIWLPGIAVEVVGTWIWLTGDTRTHKDAIKAAGYFWASKKLAWYWRPAEEKSRNRKKMTMEEVRNLHGSRKVEKTFRPSIA